MKIAFELEVEAVKLCRESGKPLYAVADELGVSINQLRKSMQDSDVAHGPRPACTTKRRQDSAAAGE